MKKITLFFALMVTFFSFGQTPIITMIADGDCSGGTPKVVEIYADGTVDFSNYTLQKSANGGEFGSNLNLTELGTVTDEFVYLYKDGETDGGESIFAAEFPSATNTLATTSDAVNFNGDDAIRIILDSDSSVVDQYGNEEDGTGTAWEYKDGYAKRNNGSTPNGAFVVTDWTFNNSALDGQGSCQSATIFQDVIDIATYETTGEGGDAALIITSPANDNIFSPSTTEVTIEFAVSNFTISSSATENNGDGYVQYSTDNGATYINKFDAENIVLAELEAGTYSVMIQLVDNDGNELDPAVEDMVTFTIASLNEVSTIAELRAGNGDDYYKLTGEAVITYLRDTRNQKYIQDDTAAILIDDAAGMITGEYNMGDAIQNITGTLSDYNGILQFVPSEDIAAAVSTGNTVAPQIITIAEFNTNYEDYESELIAFENITVSDITDGNGTFQSAKSYEISNGNETSILRTNFSEADYIDSALPTSTINLVGLGAEFNQTAQIYPRNSNDIDANLATKANAKTNFSLYPNPAKGQVTIQTESTNAIQVQVFDILGKQVIAKKVSNGSLNISSLNAGIYLVKVSQNGVASTKKLIVK